MLGYDSFEELAQRDLEHEGYLPGYPRSGFKNEISRAEQVLEIESAWQKKDGSMLLDITNRKLAEQALKEREARYRLLFDLSPSKSGSS